MTRARRTCSPRPKLDLQTGHSAPVVAVAFSPDGTLLATGSYDHTVVLWDVVAGAMRRRLLGHRQSTVFVAFAPDGQTLASGDYNNEVRIWDVATGRCLRTLSHLSGPIAFSREPGRMLALDEMHEAFVDVDPTSGQRIRTIPFGAWAGVWPPAIAISSDESTAALGVWRDTEEGEVYDLRIWDFQTGALTAIHTVPDTIEDERGHQAQASVDCLALSPDGRLLAVGGHFTLWLCDVHTGRRTRLLLCGPDGALAAAFSPDGQQLAAGCYGGGVRLWRSPFERASKEFGGHVSWASGVAFSPDGALVASVSHDNTVRVWQAESGACWRKLPGMEFDVGEVAYSPDGRFLASSHEDATIRLWRSDTGGLVHTLEGCGPLAFSPDGRMLVSGSAIAEEDEEDAVRLWDSAAGRLVHTLPDRLGPVTSLAFSPDGRFLAAGASRHDNAVRVWDLATGSVRYAVDGREDWGTTSVAISPRGDLLAVASAWIGGVRLRRMETGELVRELPELEDHEWAESLCFSPDGRTLALGGLGSLVTLWDVETGVLQRRLRPHADSISSLAFSPDGRVLAVGGTYQETVALWDVRQGVELRMLKGHTGNMRCVAFSSDGDQIATASADGTVKLWRTDTGRLLATLAILPSADDTPSQEWITYTPGGHYHGSEGVDRFVRWRLGDEILPSAAYKGTLNRPDWVARRLRKGGRSRRGDDALSPQS